MHNKWVIADLHFGHNVIKKFCPNRYGETAEEHHEWVVENWNSVVGKKDTVYLLGDVAFNRSGLKYVSRLKGHKVLIGGNHDRNLIVYKDLCSTINGCRSLQGYWLTHIPIHPQELYGRKNIHGHTHNGIIRDPNYINVSLDMNNGFPILFQDIIDGKYTTYDR
jgi:calcineurin-like phosphoesterase family protein